MHLKKIILFLVYAIITAVKPTLKSLGKKTTLICQTFLIFILLSLFNKCIAYPDEIKNISYDNIIKAIHNHEIVIYKNEYNPSKTAAIIKINRPIYINFKTKKSYILTNYWAGLVFTTWLNNSIARIEGSCGTGCTKSVIFIAPSTFLSCAEHEYRIENLDDHYPPDFHHNTPLLIDVKKGIYVCYDDNDNIQVFPLPKHPAIRPLKGFYSEKAEIRHGKLIVTYENGHGKSKRVSYGAI